MLIENEVTEMGGKALLPPYLVLFSVVLLIKMGFPEADIIPDVIPIPSSRHLLF